MNSSTNQFIRLTPEKQARIVDASISEFSDKGYETASMNKVVELAGISKGSLFNYFKSKSSLYFYIYNLALREVKGFLHTVREDTQNQPFPERLEKIIDAGVQFIIDHPRLARIYFRLVYSGDSPRRKEILTELRSISDEYLGSVIQDAINRKELDPGLNLSQSVFFLDSVLNRFLKDYHEAMGSEDRRHFDRNDWVKGITQFFSKGLGM